MGEAKLKKVKPTVRVGPHGNNYYCRNRCGRVAHEKRNKQVFIERRDLLWGWCKECKEELMRQYNEHKREAENASKPADAADAPQCTDGAQSQSPLQPE